MALLTRVVSALVLRRTARGSRATEMAPMSVAIALAVAAERLSLPRRAAAGGRGPLGGVGTTTAAAAPSRRSALAAYAAGEEAAGVMVVAVAADIEAEDTLRVVAVADGDDVIFVDVGVNVDAVCGVDGIWRLRPLRGRPDEGPAGGRAGLAKLEVVVVVVEERVAVVGGMSPPTKVEYERGLFRRTDEEPAAATSCRPPPR